MLAGKNDAVLSMQQSMQKVIIVGGGTAGWMSAAFLAKVFAGQLAITVIESPDIPTIGVGEATIPPIQLFNQLLGVDEKSFMSACHATFKLGIQFEGWGNRSEQYMHAFGPCGEQMGMLPFYHYWLKARQHGSEASFNQFSLNYHAASQAHFSHEPLGNHQQRLIYAYHFDAGAYARLLKDKAITMGVTYLSDHIAQVSLDTQSGEIAALHSREHGKLTADLYLDCSGQRALLIGEALKVPYESWQHWLPCDRALAVQLAEQSALPYTRAIAQTAGWQWKIPLQHRVGAGLVYSSAHQNDDAALKTLLANNQTPAVSEPKLIRFTPGRRTNSWVKNCIALGLSGGFLEPLESTSLHMVQSALIRLATLLSNTKPSKNQIEQYNRLTQIEAEDVRDFIIAHYHVTANSHSAFWQDCQTMHIPHTLQERLELFRVSAYLPRHTQALFDDNAWSQVLLGQGLIPTAQNLQTDKVPNEKLQLWLTQLQQKNNHLATTLPQHEAYIKNYCQA
jgi:tryptophan 7-halogenase